MKLRFVWMLAIVEAIALCSAWSPTTHADMIIFHNGERRFGVANLIAGTSDVTLTKDNITKQYSALQIRDIVFGVDSPEDIQDDIASATAIQSPTETYIPFASSGSIIDITGANVYRKTMENNDGREFIIDIEEYFDITIFRAYPIRYSFFGREGVFIVALLKNREPLPWHPAEFRLKIFNEDNTLIASKDFYVFRLPGQGNRGRVIEVEVPDVPYESVHHISIVRKW